LTRVSQYAALPGWPRPKADPNGNNVGTGFHRALGTQPLSPGLLAHKAGVVHCLVITLQLSFKFSSNHQLYFSPQIPRCSIEKL